MLASYEQALFEMDMTFGDVMLTSTYQQYALIDEDAAYYWAIDDLYVDWENGCLEALEEGWQKMLAEYAAMSYAEYLRTPHWRFLSDAVKRRDGYRCLLCNDDSATLNAHHRTYATRGEELLDHLTTLCERCHTLFHERIERPRPALPPQRFEPPV